MKSATYTNRNTTEKIKPDGTIERNISEKTITLGNAEPEFYKMYIEAIEELIKVVPNDCLSVYLEMAKNMSYCDQNNLLNSQTVYLSPNRRDEICDKFSIKKNTLSKRIKKLCDAGVICRLNPSYYMFNPKYIGRGLWKYNKKRDTGGIDALTQHYKEIQEKRYIFSSEVMDLPASKEFELSFEGIYGDEAINQRIETIE